MQLSLTNRFGGTKEGILKVKHYKSIVKYTHTDLVLVMTEVFKALFNLVNAGFVFV